MQSLQVSINDPIEVELVVDFKDSLLVYPIDDESSIHDSLEFGLDSVSSDGAGHFYISMHHNGQELIECSGIIIDEWSDGYATSDGLADMADEFDQTAMETFKALEEWNDFVSEDEDEFSDSPCSIYIDRLFVSPEYRGNGIASFILKCIPILFQRKYGYNVRYACVLLKPDGQNLMSEEKMKCIMAKTVENVGFVRISANSDSIIYAKQYHNSTR